MNSGEKNMELNDEQSAVCEQVVNKNTDWFKKQRNQPIYKKALITIGGHAGTGKTFLIGGIAKAIKSKMGKRYSIAFCTFTGKASSVLKESVEEMDAITSHDYVGTIHGLIYQPKYSIDENGKKIISGWKVKSDIECDLIIIDEASMINNEIFNDLKKYRKPIIAVGDHGQLPPIGDNFNLLQNLDYTLKTIQRQSINNPIIQLSATVRNQGYIQPGVYNSHTNHNVFKLDWNHPKTQQLFDDIKWDKNYIILCGFNQTRVELNNLIRAKKGNKLPEPYPDERVICLKNNHTTKIMNGQIGSLVWFTNAARDAYEMTVRMDGCSEFYNNLVHNHCFGKVSYDGGYDYITWKKNKSLFKRTGYSTMDLFDFGYAISVHRSQGSEWDNVVLFEQRSKYWDDEFFRRWLYTGVTRARKNLFIIYNYGWS